MAADAAGPTGAGERLFRGLGRGVVRHPWYPIIFWVLLLVITLPFLGRIGSVTTNSATNLPSSAPSAVANAQLAAYFPNSTRGSASQIVVVGPGVTGPSGQALTEGIANGLAADHALQHVSGVATVYSAYAGYLGGLGEIALGGLGPALNGSPNLLGATNGTAILVWGTVAAYVGAWSQLVVAHPGTPPAGWNAPAYNQTRTTFANSTSAEAVLAEFYGTPGAPGFNQSSCTTLATIDACSEAVARSALLHSPAVTSVPTGLEVLSGLGVSNYSVLASQQTVLIDYLSGSIGISAAVVGSVYAAFPTGVGSPTTVEAWAWNIAENRSVSSWPVPAPLGVWRPFVAPDGEATLVVVSYDVSDSYTDSTGADPVYKDVAAINSILPSLVRPLDPSGTYTATQTGPAPLDATENTVLSSTLSLVLPLTVLALVGITIVYFRSPLAPAVSFAGLGIALALGLGGVVLVGTEIGPVDSTSITLATTFVLGVGTDYSIFLIARYREELWKGAAPNDALVTTVTWAGQSIATSGATAVIATLALAFSGVALLSQWGEVLSLAVLMAVLVSLTMVPAVIRLLGPRVFWPNTGERFRKAAAATLARRAAGNTYFYRTARRVRQRPAAVLLIVLALSVPLAYIAVTAPVAYDFYGQLPNGYPATDGLAQIGEHFGSGSAFPMVLLVTFAAPLAPGGLPNASEFTDLNSLTQLIASTSGVASVSSPTGPTGAALSDWTNFTVLPTGEQKLLLGTLSGFVGSDGTTVLVSVIPNSPGLSSSAVALLANLKSSVGAFESQHPSIAQVAYGGGASETNDIRNQVGEALDRMALAVSIGLILVLLVVLRSALIPPMAVATIGLSIGWAWGITNLVLADALGLPLFYFAPTVLFILILGLGIDYNIFLLTRVREERLRGQDAGDATVQALASTGGIITAAAIILASAFAILITGQFLLLQAIGFSVAAAVLLDAMVVRTYLVPASLFLLGERVWWWPRRGRRTAGTSPRPAGPADP